MTRKQATLLTLMKLRRFSLALKKGRNTRGYSDGVKKTKLNTSEMEKKFGLTELPLLELLIIPTENKVTVVVQGKQYSSKMSKQQMLWMAQRFLEKAIRSEEE